MAIEQMICFVTPDARTEVPPSVTRRVDAMCLRIGRIHFATLALLPPLPGASDEAKPSLMLEVVVDEDLRLPELVELMIDHAFGALWQLYKHNWSGPSHADPGTKKNWLRAFLLEHASVADGGFVGARDRTVAQVLGEHALFEGARDEVQGMPSSQRPGDARGLAEHVVDWAKKNGFGWIATPAPRSRWRKGPEFGFAGKVALSVQLVVPVLAVLGFLYTLGWAALAAAWLMDWLQLPIVCTPLGSASICNASAAAIAASITVFLALLPVVVATLTRGGIVALALLAVFYAGVTVAVLLYAVVVAIAALDQIWPICAVNIGFLGAFTAVGFGVAVAWLALFPVLTRLRAPPFFPILATLGAMVLLGALGWGLAQLMFSELRLLSKQCGHGPEWEPLRTLAPMSRVGMTVLATLLVVGVAAFALLLATRWVPHMLNLARRWDKPARLPPLPAHQVHPSIQECEARLSARTSHMISLTEIKRPDRVWNRWALRFWLWFFSWLGEYVFTEGVLGSAHGIKFGHWHIIDKGRRLLFCSNFDSAFGGYLDEFIQGANEGVNLIWSNTQLLPRAAAREDHPSVDIPRSFPPTRYFIYSGCKAEQAFKAYTRASMLPHLHRFEAYCRSNQDIERATRLRDALRGSRTALKDDQIARALES